MTADAPPDWEGVRAAWLGRADLSIAAIAALFGLTPHVVRHRARMQNWGLRPPGAPRFGAGRKSGGANVTRAELVQRIYNVLSQELTIVEQRMQAILTDPSQRGETEASGVADLIGSLQKLKAEAHARQPKSKAGGEPPSARDLNKVRKELAQRVARLRKQWERRMGGEPTDG
ncbi:MAG: hypothetical protein F9K44_15920 [Hyphomicrobiaceae bacterium]|nr:MAG: hypothetical protein F9K44_15920 [Hyphomicrobiaceae bacterium]